MNNSTEGTQTWRITIGNINSFPDESNGNNKIKLDTLRKLVTTNDSDILIICEHNKNLKTIGYHHQPSEIIKKWWPQTITRSSFLASSNSSKFEPGGTMIVTNTRATAHTCQAGEDCQQLGRWNYITLKGKKDRYTTIISVYIPTKYQETYMRQTAYSAKRRKILTNEISPEELWYCDLRALITEKIGEGHEVLVAGDFNDDLNNTQSHTWTFMEELGLRELLLDKYGKGPPTHIRGSTTIDGIFATQRIHMTQGLYIPFESSPSDHRWLIVDILESSITGSARIDRVPPLLRKATSKIPSVQTSFQLLVEQKVVKHQLHSKIKFLYEIAKKGGIFTKELAKQYESIEAPMQKIIKYADKRCRKARRGTVPFSPYQKKLMGEILVLKQIKLCFLLKGKPNRPRSQRIRRLVSKYSYTGKTNFTDIHEIQSVIDKAVKKYNEFKPRAQDQQWTYLESIAREYAEKDGKNIQHHFKILQHREQTKEYFRRIRYCEGKLKGGSVDRIQVLQDEETKIIYEKNQIEDEIMRVNEIKLLQARHTPLRGEQLSILLGEQGDFDTWENILQGLVQLPDQLDDSLKVWYSYITNYDTRPTTDFTWTTREYFDSWTKISKEKTTLPGIQVAHIKCIQPDSEAAEVISLLSLIPFMVGYSPTTWRRGIDSMIPKKTADLRPEKLRLILLLDPRFNHGNKLIGKKMMEYGERHNLLAPEQYGSRKAKSAVDHATNKRFTLDIIRQSRTNAIYIANDAKSCYDRIILRVAYLTMRNFGIPRLAAQSTISTILNMKHFVRTRYGDSKTYYGGDKWDIKPHGCGQGNGYGPALWACISSPLLHILRQEGFGTKLFQPLQHEQIHISAFAFVDDTDIIQTQNASQESPPVTIHDSIKDLFHVTQSALDLWSGTLEVTGGELEDSKTYYIPILHKWRRATSTLVEQSDYQLSIKRHDGSRTTLVGKNPNDSFFTLGIWQSPSGNEQSQIDYLLQQIRTWGQNTTAHKLTWTQARIATKATIGRSLAYPLAATAFDSKQCKLLQKCLLYETLGKIGVVRTAPATLATAPTDFGGFGLMSFELEQLTQHIRIMMQHGSNRQSTTSKLLCSTLEYHALESGFSGDPLSFPVLPYVTKNTWISQTISSLRKYNIQMTSDIDGLSSWCQDDKFLMEILNKQLPPATLAIVNKVRLYLRINTLSDFLSADGNRYDQRLLTGHRSNSNPQPSYYRYRWPNVPVPTSSERSIWTREISIAFGIDLVTGQRRDSSYIQWLPASIHFSRWLYSSTSGLVYERISHTNQWATWTAHFNRARYNTRANSRTFTKSGNADNLPTDVTPVSIITARNNHIIIASTRRVSDEAIPTVVAPSHRSQPSTDPRIHKFLYNIILNNGKIFSDGSYDCGRATYAIVADFCGKYNSLDEIEYTKLLHAADMVDGSKWDLNSYRAELCGILAGIEFTNKVCNSMQLTTGACTLYCDCKGALSAAFGHKRPTPRWSSFDLVSAIRNALAASPIQWRHCYIKAHQDDTSTFKHLNTLAQGNVIADHLASKKLRDNDQTIPNPHICWRPRIDGQVICGDLPTRLQSAIIRPQMEERWKQMFGVCQHRCNWDIFFESIASQPQHHHYTLIKYHAHLLPLGKNLV